jgi:lactoylglutathione lyase
VRLEHVAVWTRDLESLERLRAFYETYFGARANALYRSARREGFASYFLTFPAAEGEAPGARLELMTVPGLAGRAEREALGYAHLALSLGSRAAVVALVARLTADGVPVRSGPRLTGDGYYEAVVADPDGNEVEVTA